MKRLSRLALAVGVLSLAACGDDPSFPPEVCAVIPNQTLHVGESKTVVTCFTDPDGGEVTLSAMSSDERVAAASIQRSALIVEAHEVGSASVTVTATDPDGETAETMFAVEVPNREPTSEAIRPIQLVGHEPIAELILTEHFSDPDGHQLTFAAESTDPEIVSATIADSILTLRAETLGSAVVTVIATDPHGLSAMETFEVSARPYETLLRDDFDNGYDRWTVASSVVVSVEDGWLGLRATNPIILGQIARVVPRADYWEVSARIKAGPSAFDSWPSLYIRTDHSEIQYVVVLFGGNLARLRPGGAETNLVVGLGGGGGANSPVGWHGMFDEIKGPGEGAMDILVRRTTNSIDITVDGELIHRIMLPNEFPTSIRAIALVSWTSIDIAEVALGNVSYFDWVQVDGVRPLGETKSSSRPGDDTENDFPALPREMRIKR